MPEDQGGNFEQPKHPRKISPEDYARFTTKDEILQSVAESFHDEVEDAKKKYSSRDFSLYLDLKNEYTNEDAMVIQHLIDGKVTIVPDAEKREPMKHFKLNAYYRGHDGSLAQIKKIDRGTSEITLEKEGILKVLKDTEFNANYHELLLYKGQVFLKPKGRGKRERMVVPRDVFASEDITGERLVCEFEGKPGETKDYSIETVLKNKLSGDGESSSQDTNDVLELTKNEELGKLSPLEKQVEILRREFVEHDLHHSGMFQKLKRVFSKLDADHTKSPEYAEKREVYLEALRALQEEKFKDFQEKSKDKSTGEQKKMVEEYLRYFQINENIRLYDTATEAKFENEQTGWFGHRAKERMKGLVDGYRSLNWKQKLAISGVFAGAAFITGGVLGAGAAAGVMLPKRALASAVLFTTAETGLNKYLDRKDAKKAERKLHSRIENVLSQELSRVTQGLEHGREDKNEERYEKLLELVNEDLATLDAQFQAKKKRVRRVKVGSLFVAIGLAAPTLTHALEGWFGGSEVAEKATEATKVTEVVKASSIQDKIQVYDTGDHAIVPDATSSENLSHNVFGTESGSDHAGTAATPAETGNVSPEAPSTPSVPEAPGTPEGATFPGYSEEPITVTSADSARGMWGILEKQLPPNLSDTERLRAVASLENYMNNQFAGMTDAQIHDLGFHRDLNLISANDQLKLSAVIPKDQFESIVSGHDVTLSPEAHSMLDGLHHPEVVTDHPTDTPHETPMSEADTADTESPIDTVTDQVDTASADLPHSAIATATDQAPGLPPETLPLQEHAGFHMDIHTDTDAHELLQNHDAHLTNATEVSDHGVGVYTVEQSDPKEFLHEYPDAKAAFQNNLKDLGGELTTIEQYGPVSNWHHDFLLRQYADRDVMQVMNQYDRSYGRIRFGRTPWYLGPGSLHPRGFNEPDMWANDQVRRVMEGNFMGRIGEMAREAVKDFGAAGAPEPEEHVKSYMQRLTTLITREKMRNPEFTFNF